MDAFWRLISAFARSYVQPLALIQRSGISMIPGERINALKMMSLVFEYTYCMDIIYLSIAYTQVLYLQQITLLISYFSTQILILSYTIFHRSYYPSLWNYKVIVK